MIRTALLALCLALPGTLVQADIFDSFAASKWAFPDVDGMRCADNPHSIAFNAERTESYFDWEGPMINYLGEIDQDAVYDVVDHTDRTITLYLREEARRTDSGKPVIWILTLMEGDDAYCWSRTDWTIGACDHIHIRCGGPALSS